MTSNILDFDSYLDMKARSYPENDWILSERDKQARSIEKQNKIIKLFCLFLLAVFIVFSLIYPQRSYELTITWLNNLGNAFTNLSKAIFNHYLT